MRALIVYESMYGNTHLVADAIAEGLRARRRGRRRAGRGATRARVADVDLLVVGGPTHVHGMSRREHPRSSGGSRREAGQRARR